MLRDKIEKYADELIDLAVTQARGGDRLKRLKRLDVLHERKLDAELPVIPFIVIGEHDDGKPYRKTGESEAACLTRYGLDPKHPSIFVQVVDASVPRPNDH